MVLPPSSQASIAVPLNDETPLLTRKHEDVYDRFSSARKKALIGMVSLYGVLPFFVSGTFIPSIPQIAEDLNTTGEVVGLAVSISIFGASLGALIGSSYSSFYGRRPVYLWGLPLFIVGSCGVASAYHVSDLLVWRLTQALGASSAISLGAGVIADIYKLEERGQAMGIFFSATLLGPALAPVIGGLVAHYSSWRTLQLLFAMSGIVIFVIMVFCFPETSHPGERGIEKLTPGSHPKWRPVFLNPLGPLWLLRSPNLLAVTICGLLTLLTDYVLLVPIAYTIGKAYDITNEALIGACFLPAGLGNMIGAPLAGYLSDKIVVKWRKQRGGIWYPEDRLRVTLFGGLTLVPLSILVSGVLTTYVRGSLGLVLNLFCFFVNGIGVDLVLSPSAAYAVDIVHSRSAESIAANNGLRSFILSIMVAGILPLIQVHGVLATNTLAALLAWCGTGLIWLTIRYGEKMRMWINVGYSTTDVN